MNKFFEKQELKQAVFFTFIFFILVSPLLTGLFEPMWDARDYDFPAFSYLMDSLKDFRFPLWDPYSNGGIPFHAEPVNPIVSPLAILYTFIFSKSFPAFMAYWLTLWWWGGVGMIFLCRLYSCSFRGGIAAALAFVFSGFFIGHAEHTSFLCAAAWLPWVFFTGELSIIRKNSGYAIISSLFLGLSSLGGYPVLVFYTGFSLALWLFIRYASRENFPRIIIHLAVIAAGAIIIWSPVLVSFFIAGPDFTIRTGPLSLHDANYTYIFTPVSALSLVSPFTNIIGRDFLGTDISMANGYTGIFSIPLTAMALYHYRKKENIVKYIILFIFFILVSLGGYGGVKLLLYYILPPFGYMHYSSPFRYMWIFILALGAGIGFSVFEKKNENFRINGVILNIWFLMVMGIVLFVIYFLEMKNILKLKYLFRLFAPSLMILPLLLACIVLHKRNIIKDMRKLALVFFILIIADSGFHLYTNRKTVFTKRKLTDDNNLNYKKNTYLQKGPGPRMSRYTDNEMAFNRQYINKDFMVYSYTTLTTPAFTKLTYESKFLSVMELPDFYWLSPGVIKSGSDDNVLSALGTVGKGDVIPVFAEENIPLHKKPVKFGQYGKTEILIYSPEYIKINVSVPDREGGFLASTERFARGWKAFIDGVEKPVIRHNVFFRGLYVPEGRHRIEWRYDPGYWTPLVLASFIYMAVSLISGIILIRRREG